MVAANLVGFFALFGANLRCRGRSFSDHFLMTCHIILNVLIFGSFLKLANKLAEKLAAAHLCAVSKLAAKHCLKLIFRQLSYSMTRNYED